jgi:GDPmannose 4,6-dehydratase
MNAERRAMVIGAAGQDGSYACEALLEQGYAVTGVVRGDPAGALPNLDAVRHRMRVVRADLIDTPALERLLAEVEPDRLYNFASVSFGPDAWADPVATTTLGTVALAGLLEAVRRAPRPPRFFQASSSWVFGQPSVSPQNEATPFAPVEPYGAAKAFGNSLIRAYRDRYDLFACSGIFFNHESPRRPERFVTRKVTRAAAKIHLGLVGEVRIADLEARRDWGYAPDYVGAALAMLDAPRPADYVIATGKLHSVRELVELAFAQVGLDWEEHVRLDTRLNRGRGAVANLVGDASRAKIELGWIPRTSFEALVPLMVDADVAELSAS